MVHPEAVTVDQFRLPLPADLLPVFRTVSIFVIAPYVMIKPSESFLRYFDISGGPCCGMGKRSIPSGS